jgi:catechol 2,3-dioxygenase-like lactoylglutathione lyase family enzyme
MPATALDHYNVFCRDLKQTVAFYERYVGLRIGDRPPFSFPGAWLYAGDKAVLHLVSESGRDAQGSGAIDHIAFNCEGLPATVQMLERDGIKYEIRKVPGRPLQQVFIHDPDGVMLELNFRNEPVSPI